jgi:hypothetical protein
MISFLSESGTYGGLEKTIFVFLNNRIETFDSRFVRNLKPSAQEFLMPKHEDELRASRGISSKKTRICAGSTDTVKKYVEESQQKHWSKPEAPNTQKTLIQFSVERSAL